MTASDVQTRLAELYEIKRNGLGTGSENRNSKGALAAYGALIETARQAILTAHQGMLIGAQAHDAQAARWAGIVIDEHPLREDDGYARLLTWDHHGFIDSEPMKNETQALETMLNRGYLFPDPGALVRLAGTDAFSDGNYRRHMSPASAGLVGIRR